MPVKCDFKVAGKTFLISAPRGLDMLPGRMVRRMIKNMEKQYQLSEYSLVKGGRAVDEMEDVIGNVLLKSGAGSWLFGTQPFAVFQRLHPSMYDADFIQLGDEETMDFQSRLPEGEPYNYEDFTLSMPSDYFIAVGINMKKLIKVLDHLRLDTFDDVRDAVARLSIASITIYDEADMFVEYNEDSFPTILTDGIEDYLNAPEEVDELEF